MPEIGIQIMNAAQGFVGTPFHWEQALEPSNDHAGGMDCRGLVTCAARNCGRPEANAIEALAVGYSRRIDEAKLIAGLDRLFDRVALDPATIDLARPGDVLGFRLRGTLQHLGVYSGNMIAHRMVHAYSGDPAQVVETPMLAFWRNRLAGIWRWRTQEVPGGH